MMAFAPRPLSEAELRKLARHTESLGYLKKYAQWIEAVDTVWNASKLDTAREAAFEARPRGDRCVYCQDNEGREIDHLRPKTLHPLLAFCWSNLIPACSTCGGSDHKGARDAIVDFNADPGYREITRPRKRKGIASPIVPPPEGSTAWWNPRLADPLRAMKLDILGGSFQFLVTAAAGTADHSRIHWTIETLKLNKRQTLVRQRRSAYASYREWLAAVIEAQRRGDEDTLARLRNDLKCRNQPVVWAEMKRQHLEIAEVSQLFAEMPEVLAW